LLTSVSEAARWIFLPPPKLRPQKTSPCLPNVKGSIEKFLKKYQSQQQSSPGNVYGRTGHHNYTRTSSQWFERVLMSNLF